MHSDQNNSVVQRVMNGVVAGTSVQTSSTVDCQGCEKVRFIAAFGVISASAVTNIEVHESDAASSGFTALAGSKSATLTPTTDNNKCLEVEIVKPLKRYLRLIVNRATGNAVIDGAVAIKTMLRNAPPALDATVAGREVHVSPIAGTA